VDPQDSELGKGDPQSARSPCNEAAVHKGFIENHIATEISSAEIQIFVEKLEKGEPRSTGATKD